jgi:ABC-type branched-subunit amino acid transport system substrate-binding protein
MKTPAAKALEAMLHVVSAAPAVSSELPGVKKMVAAYEKKFPGSPVDSGVLSGYNAAQLLGADLKKACEAGSLAREDVVKAHRSQKNADTGLGTPQDFSDVDRPASVETYVLKPDAKAVGGIVVAEEAHKAPGVEEYLNS